MSDPKYVEPLTVSAVDDAYGKVDACDVLVAVKYGASRTVPTCRFSVQRFAIVVVPVFVKFQRPKIVSVAVLSTRFWFCIPAIVPDVSVNVSVSIPVIELSDIMILPAIVSTPAELNVLVAVPPKYAVSNTERRVVEACINDVNPEIESVPVVVRFSSPKLIAPLLSVSDPPVSVAVIAIIEVENVPVPTTSRACVGLAVPIPTLFVVKS